MPYDYSSKLLENAVKQFTKLPGIGEKTALRLVLNLLEKDVDDVRRFSDAIVSLKENVNFCKICNNISDEPVCPICSDNSRQRNIVCVVENIKDIIAIEKTMQYRGLYHVLGGLISPLDGVSPSDIDIAGLENRLVQGEIDEVILALNTTMEGETTSFFVAKRLKKYNVKISSIARGVGFGDELEYTDEITLGRAITNRTAIKF